jgi:UDP-N-acetylglucosamine 2-epimerase
VAHVASSPEDVPRLAGMLAAVEETGAFAQVVLDAGGHAAIEAVLAEFELRTRVVALGRTPAVPADIGGLLAERDCAVLVVHADDHAGLCAAIAAAQQGIAVVRVGGVPITGSGRVIARLADVLLTRSPHDAVAQPQVIAPERSAVIGDPLAEMIRRHARAALDRAAWRDAGAQPGNYVLAVLTSQPLASQVAGRVKAIAAGRPVIAVDRAAGFLERLSLERAARAIVTDSRRVQQEAATLGVPCHLVEGDLCAVADASPIPLWDARAGELAARALVANFACVRLD